jgi:hypothetical protein
VLLLLYYFQNMQSGRYSDVGLLEPITGYTNDTGEQMPAPGRSGYPIGVSPRDPYI